MNAAASITTDDGDKVNHGWSQLDIAKHSTNTFVSSLQDGDYFSVVTYSDAAKVLVDWTLCNNAGRESCIAAIHSMRPERSTNLMAGITSGFGQFEKFKDIVAAELDKYALSLVITTDGMPSAQWHPARGRDGYAPLVKSLKKKLVGMHPAAPPTVTTIGIGFQLDSELLLNMSETFLHMPDPGQIGPFIVNLLAAVRCTARLPAQGGAAANSCSLLVAPATALEANVVPGYKTEPVAGGALRVHLGSVLYDQPRHVMLKTRDGEAAPTVTLEVGGAALPDVVASAAPRTAESEKQAQIEELRIKAVLAIQASLAAGTANHSTEETAAPLLAFVVEAKASAVAAEPAVAGLIETVEKECVLGCDQADNFKRWGGHYFRTLPCMLAAERRSNFRDQALQHFGKDALGREALFEDQSNTAEMTFATLKPPEPSLLRPQAPDPMPMPGGGGSMPAPPMASPPPRPMALPDEFMRGGGCFGPRARVRIAMPDGSSRTAAVGEVCAGDRLVGEGGLTSRVVCVVMTACAGGRAMLTRLPNGTELTEWHPVRDGRGTWRFPIMLGERVVVSASHVYNFVLEPGHATLVVGGVPCAALGHGLQGAVVAHPYWGTHAVIDDLMSKDGWREGRVVLDASREAV
mmetsp:Transcript_20743/g.52888  ORF Transcript_20743/g.52888 Transcript_20743/m.52888 type:complete len:634 (+) Transcript_20743:353-2254(+)